jgi:hypothetical protein
VCVRESVTMYKCAIVIVMVRFDDERAIFC